MNLFKIKLNINLFNKIRGLLVIFYFFTSIFLLLNCSTSDNQILIPSEPTQPAEPIEPPKSENFVMRALWVDPPGFGTPQAVDLMIEKCQRAGINTILTIFQTM